MKMLYYLCIFQVHLCEAVNIGDYLTDGYLVNRTVSRPVLVAVKMLYYLCVFQVHLCEAVNIGDYLTDEYLVNRTVSRPVLVAVKMLRKDADDKARLVSHIF